jgi:hypothetical protein
MTSRNLRGSSPAPEVGPEEVPPVSARERVYRHARQLLQAGAAAGGAIAVACSCVACDPVPAPFVCAEPGRAPDFLGETGATSNGQVAMSISGISGGIDIPPSKLTLGTPANVAGGTVVSQSNNNLLVTPSGETVTFDIPASLAECDAGTETLLLHVVLDVHGGAGGTPATTVTVVTGGDS